MPPKAKITKEMIVEEAFKIIRKDGVEKVTARSISEGLHCSTQPVLYYYATVDDIKKETYRKADEYHSNYIMNINMENDSGNPMLAIGMNYIKFAIEERNLFHFLFQTNEFSGKSMMNLMDSEGILPILGVLQKKLNVAEEEAKLVFNTLFIFVHGYASLYANNSMNYDEGTIAAALETVFQGAICVVKDRKDKVVIKGRVKND